MDSHQGPQPSEWTNIIPPIDDSSPNDSQMFRNSFSYTGNFIFYALLPSTEYEVIIQSKNREGWSEPTDIFRFSTRSRGSIVPKWISKVSLQMVEFSECILISCCTKEVNFSQFFGEIFLSEFFGYPCQLKINLSLEFVTSTGYSWAWANRFKIYRILGSSERSSELNRWWYWKMSKNDVQFR